MTQPYRTKTSSRVRRTPAERFWAKVEQGGAGCWIWTAGRNERGVGLFALMGERKMIQAHRYAFQLYYGSIPEGMHVLHSCDNPPCVNPLHLWLGTHADNMADMAAKGRGRNGHTPGYRSKLTPELVREIRFKADVAGATWAALGRAYGVHEDTIKRAVLGITWRKVA